MAFNARSLINIRVPPSNALKHKDTLLCEQIVQVKIQIVFLI